MLTAPAKSQLTIGHRPAPWKRGVCDAKPHHYHHHHHPKGGVAQSKKFSGLARPQNFGNFITLTKWIWMFDSGLRKRQALSVMRLSSMKPVQRPICIKKCNELSQSHCFSFLQWCCPWQLHWKWVMKVGQGRRYGCCRRNAAWFVVSNGAACALKWIKWLTTQRSARLCAFVMLLSVLQLFDLRFVFHCRYSCAVVATCIVFCSSRRSKAVQWCWHSGACVRLQARTHKLCTHNQSVPSYQLKYAYHYIQ